MRRRSINYAHGAIQTLLLLLVPSAVTQAQIVDNLGTEFFIGFMPNENEEARLATTELLIASDTTTNVTVEYPALEPTFTTTVPVVPGQITLVDLGTDPAFRWTPGAKDSNVVRVTAVDPITVYAVNRQDASTDAAVALPVDALGREYIVQGYFQYYEYSVFAVVAAHDGTIVTITPTVDLQGGFSGDVPFQVTLNRGQGFLGQSLGDSLTTEGDVSGTIIESSLPVQVSNGHVCGAVRDAGGSCDHLFEIAQPVPSWEMNAIAAPPAYSPEGAWYRVLASEDNTSISLNGDPVGTLNRAEFLELAALEGAQVFEADRPILVTQFHRTIVDTGDPSMLTLQPPSQYLNQYTFSTVGGNQFGDDYLAIIASDDDISAGTMLLNGTAVPASEFTSIPTTGYSYAILGLAEGSHTTSSTQPHQIVVQGVDPFDTYMYHGGTMFNNPINTAAIPETVQRDFRLGANYPNPFSTTTRIPVELDRPASVSLMVFDVLGRAVATVLRQNLAAGTHEVEWNGRDAAGVIVPNGLYLYRLDAGGQSVTRTMILFR